jgi:hypothetical protein
MVFLTGAGLCPVPRLSCPARRLQMNSLPALMRRRGMSPRFVSDHCRQLNSFVIHKSLKMKPNDNKKRMLCEGSSLRIGMLSAPADLKNNLKC